MHSTAMGPPPARFLGASDVWRLCSRNVSPVGFDASCSVLSRLYSACLVDGSFCTWWSIRCAGLDDWEGGSVSLSCRQVSELFSPGLESTSACLVDMCITLAAPDLTSLVRPRRMTLQLHSPRMTSSRRRLLRLILTVLQMHYVLGGPHTPTA
jgi:hypothetical protein